MWFWMRYGCQCEDRIDHAQQIYVSAVSLHDDVDWMLSHDHLIVCPD